MKKLWTWMALGLLAVGCSQKTSVDEAARTITQESLMKPIEVLSSDDFRGRAPGSEGEQKTVDYLVSQYKEIGLEPGMPGGGYVQDVPVTGQTTHKDAVLTIKKGGKTVHTFNYATDFMAWPSNGAEQVDVNGAELVYVGYGIQAPEENWDDFKDVDVKGKIIVVKNNDPEEDPDLFGGKTRLYYGRYDYKYEKARELGALGVLIVHTTPTAGYPWEVVANSWSGERFNLRDAPEMQDNPTKFNGWLTKEGSEALFQSAGLDLMEQLDAAEDRGFQPVPLEGLRASLELSASYRDMEIKNVLGVIRGSDDQLKKQYMVLTAHHDHLGVGTPVKGDSIYNGALDNASGVSGMLNLARAYKKVQPSLKRSVLVLAVGGEEQGLLGSKYYAAHPTVEPGRISANLNLDGLNVFGKTRDIIAIGYGRSTIDDILQAEAEKEGREIKPDQFPDRGYYYRSDHFSFAKIGVPALYPDMGTEFIDKPEGYGREVVEKYTAENYHAVSDEISDSWDMSGAVEDVRLFFHTGYRILNADKMRQWNPGDEFEAKRMDMLKEAGTTDD